MEKGKKDFKISLSKGITNKKYNLDLINPQGKEGIKSRGYQLEFINEDTGESLGFYNKDGVYGNISKEDLRCNSQNYRLIKLEDLDKKTDEINVIISREGDGIVKGFINRLEIGTELLTDNIHINIEDEYGNILSKYVKEPKMTSMQPFPFHMKLENQTEKYIISITSESGKGKKVYYNKENYLTTDKKDADRLSFLELTSNELMIYSENINYYADLEITLYQDDRDFRTSLKIETFVERDDGVIVNRNWDYIDPDKIKLNKRLSFTETLSQIDSEYIIYYKISNIEQTPHFVEIGYLTDNGFFQNKENAKTYTPMEFNKKEFKGYILEKNEENIINIKDKELKEIILNQLGTGKDEIYLKDVEKIESLDLRNSNVTSIVGLDQFQKI